MSAHWVLRLIHFLYVAFATISAWLRRHKRQRPNPLRAERSKIPKHLCLNLVADDVTPAQETEDAFLQCLQSVASWCRVLGVETLSVYDRHGILYGCSENAYQRVFATNETSEDSYESEVEYPLTPPSSEYSCSRSHSPEHMTHPVDSNVVMVKRFSCLRRRRNVAVRKQFKSKGPSRVSGNLTLYIISRASGKPAIVSVSRSLLQTRVSAAPMSGDAVPRKFLYNLTVSQLAMVLEAGFPPPDFMIIHHIGGMKMPYLPIELHSFPPWQNSLTEFHRTYPNDDQDFSPCRFEMPGATRLISEAAFCRALDEYAGAEIRLGK